MGDLPLLQSNAIPVMSNIKYPPKVENWENGLGLSNIQSNCPLQSPLEISAMKREYEEDELTPGKKLKLADGEQVSLTVPNLQLNTGAQMPQVMFGTYKTKGESCFSAVLSALRSGYRGMDTASVYANEKEVGAAIRESGIPRQQLFIQTKLWRSFVGNGKNGKPRCDAELRKSLRSLGTDYVDVWLMHWPGPGRHLNYPPVRMGMDRPKQPIQGNEAKVVPVDWTPQLRLQAYKDMCKHVGPAGSVRALGVCNFSIRQMEELVAFCKENQLPLPAVVQNECHPYLIAKEVREYCQQKGIVFQAYASLGAGALNLMDNPVVKRLAALHDVTPAQVLLRWSVQHGCSVLPKSVNEARQKTNISLWNFKVAQEEMDELDGLNRADAGQNTMAGWLREYDPDVY